VAGVQLERPQPRSGEDERAGCRWVAADDGGRGRGRCGLGFPGVRGGRSGLTCTHAAPCLRWRAAM